MMWTVRAVVNRVVDGDTFDADLDLGWGVWRHSIKGAPSRIRLLGVNTPERGQPGFTEATSFLAALLPAGSSVWVESTALDSFGRALCNVTLADGSSLREQMPLEWRI